jgi:predicted phage terminase large subunit-like protein
VESFLRVTVLENPYIPHLPHPPQWAALALPNREALYGGAAGGGKSDWLLMCALQFVHLVPGYNAILFRKTFTDLKLPGSLETRSKEWLSGTQAHWNGNDHRWTFPRTGATLSFSYLNNEADKYRYQSSEFQFIGFDELTHFSRGQYTYMGSRLRRLASANVRLRMRAGSNPGGFGHEWVKDRFLVEGPSKGRAFVPARLEDNPSLDAASYEESLDELDPVTRRQLRYGDWDTVLKGNLFDRNWCERVGQGPERALRVRYWDKAATDEGPGSDPDWTAGVRVAFTGRRWVIEDVQRFRGNPAIVERRILDTTIADGRGVVVGIEQEGGSAGKSDIYTWQQKLQPLGISVWGNHPTGDKVTRSLVVSSAMAAKNVDCVAAPWNNEYWNELEPFPTPKLHDDQVDATSGAWWLLAELLKKMGHGKPATGGERRHAAYQPYMGG